MCSCDILVALQVAEKFMLSHCEHELAQRARIVSETQAQICLPPFSQVCLQQHPTQHTFLRHLTWSDTVGGMHGKARSSKVYVLSMDVFTWPKPHLTAVDGDCNHANWVCKPS